MLVLALGILGLIIGVFQKMKAGRVADAPLVKTGDAAARGTQVAGPRGAIAIQGQVACQQPLISPVTGTPCLYYHLEVTASWKDGDTNKEKQLTSEKRAAQFVVDDGTGGVWVDAHEGGDFEPMTTKEETKGTGLLGGITGADLVFGNYRVSPGMLSMGTKYTVKEKVMPLVQRMYACGRAGESGAVVAPGWRQLILSNKSRDEILASATLNAKRFLIGGGAASAAGTAMAIIASLLGGGEANAADNPPTASAPATAATVETTAARPASTAAIGAGAARPTQNRPAAQTKSASSAKPAPATSKK